MQTTANELYTSLSYKYRFHWYAVCDINISLNMPKSLSKKDYS